MEGKGSEKILVGCRYTHKININAGSEPKTHLLKEHEYIDLNCRHSAPRTMSTFPYYGFMDEFAASDNDKET